MKSYFQSLSFLSTEMENVVEMRTHREQSSTYRISRTMADDELAI